jgi:WD40 repeat protein
MNKKKHTILRGYYIFTSSSLFNPLGSFMDTDTTDKCHRVWRLQSLKPTNRIHDCMNSDSEEIMDEGFHPLA